MSWWLRWIGIGWIATIKIPCGIWNYFHAILQSLDVKWVVFGMCMAGVWHQNRQKFQTTLVWYNWYYENLRGSWYRKWTQRHLFPQDCKQDQIISSYINICTCLSLNMCGLKMQSYDVRCIMILIWFRNFTYDALDRMCFCKGIPSVDTLIYHICSLGRYSGGYCSKHTTTPHTCG